MDVISALFNFVMHVDQNLGPIIQTYGFWAYLIIFIVIFSETGFVVTPFLPGDSLLFVAGWLASIGLLDIKMLFIVFGSAAIIGDTINYSIGKYVGPKVFNKTRLFKREYLDDAHEFYEKHGGKSIVLARFIPFIRTFVPFTAGMGSMEYMRFLFYNIFGGLLWVAAFLTGGYLFGNIPIIKNNLSMIILAIIFITTLPAFTKLFLAIKSKYHGK
jgi:membrane-associated protein